MTTWRYDSINSLAIDGSGKIVAGGYGEGAGWLVARFRPTGRWIRASVGRWLCDHGFRGRASCGSVLIDGGKILPGGQSDGCPAFVRYNSDGTLDSGFNSDGKLLVPTKSPLTARWPG